MYALKTPSFLKPASRPTSPSPSPTPRPDSAMPAERIARPMSKLSFSTFKRTASPLTQPPTALVHDGSYMEVLSLKLSEAISKALAQPVGPGAPNEMLGGRRPLPAGRGRALGEQMASEIKSARDDPHLYRAVLCSLHRPLSVLVTNLSGNLLPLIASPSFLSPALPSPQNPNPNSTQLHALGLATFAGELLETFDEFSLGLESGMRSDGLKTIRDSLVSTIKRVIDPLVNGIRNDLTPYIEALEQASNVVAKTPGATKVTAAHPSIVYLAAVIPVYARALSRYITSASAESMLASLVICLIWRGLVALSNRLVASTPVTPPGSPPLASAAKGWKDMKRRGSSATPPATPPASRFALKLPPSRPPSPTNTSGKSTIAGDAKALYDLLNMLPRPTNTLAREAVDDGYESLSALVALFEFLQTGQSGANGAFESASELQAITAEIPVLIALPVLLHAYVFPSSSYPHERTVASMLGLAESVYRSGCLSGFGRAEECVIAVGQRILDVLHVCDANMYGKDIVMHWLEREVADAILEQQPQH